MSIRAVINTVGTSLIANFKKNQPGCDVTEDNLLSYMNKRPESEICAETNALSRIKNLNENDDYLYFLCSESEEGTLCGHLLHRYYEKRNFYFSKVIPIEGLVKEFDIFKTKGLINLVNTLCDLIKEYKSNVIINATGGYKAEIAYATLIGILFKVSVFYIHEDFKGIVELPLLPINFDFRTFSAYSEEFSKILGAETNKEARSVLDKLPQEFVPLFQKKDKEKGYTLSPAGRALDRTNEFFRSGKEEMVPIKFYKRHSTLWGDSVKSMRDVRDKEVRLILKRICRISKDIKAFHLEEIERQRTDTDVHFEFKEIQKGRVKYVIITNYGSEYLDIEVPQGKEKRTLKLLGKKIYP